MARKQHNKRAKFDRGSYLQLDVAGSVLSNSFKRNCIGIARDIYRSSLTPQCLVSGNRVDRSPLGDLWGVNGAVSAISEMLTSQRDKVIGVSESMLIGHLKLL